MPPPKFPHGQTPPHQTNARTETPRPVDRISAADLASTIPNSTINPAKWMHERLIKSIIDFEAGLDTDHGIGARLVNFNANEVISIDDVRFWGPDLVIFDGTNVDGQPVELLQHLTQVNVLLVAIRKQQENPKCIGFILEEGLKEQEAE